jgi:hypothetical protein
MDFGNNVGQKRIVVMPIAFHKQEDFDSVPFKPCNNIGTLQVAYEIGNDVGETALNFKKESAFMKSGDEISLTKYVWKSMGRFMSTYIPINGFMIRAAGD